MAYFSERLRELRLKKGLSQQDLADLLNMNKQTISGYERGVRRPAGEGAMEIYEALADCFNVDISYLLGISDYSVSLVDPIKVDYILSDNEKILIEQYRKAAPDVRKYLEYILKMNEQIEKRKDGDKNET